MAPISQMIRDLQRVIRKKTEKGESLDGLNFKLQKLLEDKKFADGKKAEKKHATKYHMVKFIEVKKHSTVSIFQQNKHYVPVDVYVYPTCNCISHSLSFKCYVEAKDCTKNPCIGSRNGRGRTNNE